MGGGLAISLTMHLHNEEKKKREKNKKILDLKEGESNMASNKIMLVVTEQYKAKS